MNEEKPRWVSTNYTTEKGVTIWRFEGSQVYAFAVALMVGFSVAYYLIAEFKWPMLTSALAGFLFPLLSVVVLLNLVVGKPQGYLTDWLEWQIIQRTKGRLLRVNERQF